MIVIFKTDVISPEQAEKLTFHLNVNYPTFDVNFDLSGSSGILQVSTYNQPLDKTYITELFRCLGFKAEAVVSI